MCLYRIEVMLHQFVLVKLSLLTKGSNQSSHMHQQVYIWFNEQGGRIADWFVRVLPDSCKII